MMSAGLLVKVTIHLSLVKLIEPTVSIRPIDNSVLKSTDIMLSQLVKVLWPKHPHVKPPTSASAYDADAVASGCSGCSCSCGCVGGDDDNEDEKGGKGKVVVDENE